MYDNDADGAHFTFFAGIVVGVAGVLLFEFKPEVTLLLSGLLCFLGGATYPYEYSLIIKGLYLLIGAALLLAALLLAL